MRGQDMPVAALFTGQLVLQTYTPQLKGAMLPGEQDAQVGVRVDMRRTMLRWLYQSARLGSSKRLRPMSRIASSLRPC